MQEKYKTIVKYGKQFGFPQDEQKELDKLKEIYKIHAFHTIIGNDDFLGADARLIILDEDEETTGCVIIYDHQIADTFIRVWKSFDLRIPQNQDLQYAIHLYDVNVWPEFHKNERYINEINTLLGTTTCENYDQFLFILNSDQKEYVVNSKAAQDIIHRHFDDNIDVDKDENIN